jgi:hypothetical protein
VSARERSDAELIAEAAREFSWGMGSAGHDGLVELAQGVDRIVCRFDPHGNLLNAKRYRCGRFVDAGASAWRVRGWCDPFRGGHG